MKKHLSHFLLFSMSFSLVSPLFSADEPSIGRMIGKELAGGIVEGMKGEIDPADIGRAVGPAIGGLREAFAEGGEFEGAIGDLGGAFGRGIGPAAGGVRAGMRPAARELAGGLEEGAEEFGQMGQRVLEEGSEVDKAAEAGVDMGLRHFERLKEEGRETLGELRGATGKSLKKVAFGGLGTAAVYFVMKFGIPLYFRMLERMLTRPKLIIASSKKSLKEQIIDLFKKKPEPVPMVFAPELEERLDTVTKATRNITKKLNEGKKNVKYRNLMLYGPPGTGKTMFAKELARRSGMEYAFMSGSSFAKFPEGQGIEALDELMAWAAKSKGLMIFIDEAETFLAKREKMDPNSQAYKLLNNFLNYTGERSPKFMLVFATNHKDALDSAMYRRIDDLVEMPLPGLAERKRVLTLYRDKILMDEKQNGVEFVDSVREYLDGTVVEQIAERTKGLSGGDLEGIINTIKTDADILDPAILSPELTNRVVDRAIEKYESFTKGQALGRVAD